MKIQNLSRCKSLVITKTWAPLLEKVITDVARKRKQNIVDIKETVVERSL